MENLPRWDLLSLNERVTGREKKGGGLVEEWAGLIVGWIHRKEVERPKRALTCGNAFSFKFRTFWIVERRVYSISKEIRVGGLALSRCRFNV